MEIARQLVDTLFYLHQRGIVHRDIKPANIIVSRYEHKIYLIDFGLACHNEDSEDWKYGTYGTYLFMPVRIHNGPYNTEDDIESLVYTLVYLVLGYVPWEVDFNEPLSLSRMAIAKGNFYYQYIHKKPLIEKLQMYEVDETLRNFLLSCIATFKATEDQFSDAQ